MIVILCLDDKNGMMFNNRRQSKDKVVIQDILKLINGKKLFINSYSENLFQNSESNLIIDNNFLNNAAKEDYCFVEDNNLQGFSKKIEKIIVYRWNRMYPSDLKLEIPIQNWNLADSFEFTGNSHDKITREVYIK
ncbi:MAG: ribonuclease Z [Candidatus Pseudoruminococcus sp.]|nr:ribonuclease Z [Ruminococcus sp.]MDY2783300.1 ribonuclease Z [Candidatus Pseudoruminococcus sp.]